MENSVLKLYPLPNQERPLKGLYLSHNLRQYSEASGEAFVYGNFVTSLDGRIAIPHQTRPGMVVPKQTANDRDWRLFQELAVQADVLITSGRYLRDYADGRAQEILRVYEDPQFADIKNWRLEHGLSPMPALAVISNSLSFPVPRVLRESDQEIFIVTTNQADLERVKIMEEGGCKILMAGENSVEGGLFVKRLNQLGYHVICSATGPKVLHLLLASNVLDRLYLTHANLLLGGQPYSSIVEGELFNPAIGMTLKSVYYDSHGLDGLGQLFVSYDTKQMVS